ncbi:hypothetical protein [Oricola sp.]|uniref:hypothetical protein n=1 Tax=Oricola sp. TaxID=1979950 RepID=UPI0025D15535|nr:hypothetical protein [Oricola sp.]MCI5075761.1 hypothetical protein [Oricola sp.]
MTKRMTTRGLSLAAALFLAIVQPVASAAQGMSYPATSVRISFPPDFLIEDVVARALEATRAYEAGDEETFERVESFLADSVVFYIGDVELSGDERFDHWGRYDKTDVFWQLGRKTAYGNIKIDEAEARGVGLLEELLADGVIGLNSWLGGEYCTSSYGKLAHDEMAALVEETGTLVHDWRVATKASGAFEFREGETPLTWEEGQLLLVDPKSPFIRGHLRIVTPDGSGAYVRMDDGQTGLQPYLSSHVCFEEREDDWAISAIALRIP